MKEPRTIQLLVLIAGVLLLNTAVSQTSKIDSITALIKTAKDTDKVNLMNALTVEFYYAGLDEEAFKNAGLTLTEAQKLNFYKGLINVHNQLGRLYRGRGEFEKAILHFRIGGKLCQTNGSWKPFYCWHDFSNSSCRFYFKKLRYKEMANRLLEEKNLLIETQKKQVEQKQKEIVDSLHYAMRIQAALMASEKYVGKTLRRLRNGEGTI